VTGQEFVMYERTLAPGFHDLVLGMLRNAGIVPNVSQTAGEMPTLISLVDAGMGLSILPASAVKHSVASSVTHLPTSQAEQPERVLVQAQQTGYKGSPRCLRGV
jgi:DNA-binding transcriptional LysR family regulator